MRKSNSLTFKLRAPPLPPVVHKKTRAKPFYQLRKYVSTMGFQTKTPPGLALLVQPTTIESDSEFIASTIPTQNRNKPSKIDHVGPFTDNAGFHLVTHSGNTQPKIKSNTTAPPRPLRYPQEQYEYSSKVPKTKKKLIHTVLNFPVKKVPENSRNSLIMNPVVTKLFRSHLAYLTPIQPPKHYSKHHLPVPQVRVQSMWKQQQILLSLVPTQMRVLPTTRTVLMTMIKLYKFLLACSTLIQYLNV